MSGFGLFHTDGAFEVADPLDRMRRREERERLVFVFLLGSAVGFALAVWIVVATQSF